MNGPKVLILPWLKDRLLQRLLKNSITVNFNKRQQAVIFLLLADLLDVGFSVRHALHFIGTVKPPMLLLVKQVDQQMQDGFSFAQSLKSNIKADLYYQLLLAEKHGNLAKTLKETGRLMQVQEKQRKKLMGLLQYPLILLIMLAVVITCLVIFVFPELKSWQQTNNSVSLLKWGSSLGYYFLMVIITWGLFRYWQWRKLSKEEKIIRQCRLPIVGKCYCYYYQYYLTSILGMMIQEGMSLAEICQLTQNFNDDSILYVFGKKVMKILQEGGELTTLVTNYSFLPNELIVFMNKGETLEKIGQDLTAFANFQFKALTNAIERLLIYVQPIVFSIIAVVIVSLYLSILLPIYHSFQGVY